LEFSKLAGGSKLHDAIAQRPCELDGLFSSSGRVPEVSAVGMGRRQVEQQLDALAAARLCERGRSQQHLGRGAPVSDRQRAASCGFQPCGRAPAEALVGHPKLDAVEVRLLEVVAEDLVQLDELGAVLFVPGTIQALLAARLDQLEPAERGVLERGSVEGRVFQRCRLRRAAEGDPWRVA
jgi:hypothetical protein